MNAAPLLKELFQTLSPAEFLDRYFLKLPCSQPGACRSAASLVDWEAVHRILSNPAADVLIGRKGTRWEGPVPQTRAAIEEVLQAGYTIGIRHVQQIDSALREYAEQFERGFAAAADIHLYCTPAGQPGFGWHYDAEDVFVLQTQGDKEWRLRKNTVNPWPLIDAIPANQRYEREIMPVMSCRLAAGDWLYIPAGYWHQTQAGESSISLSIGLRTPTALDVFDFLRSRLAETLEWRQRLPCCGELATDPAITQHMLAAIFEELAGDLGTRLKQPLLREQFLATRKAVGPAIDCGGPP
jgi:ribosomal protein L16 Arg81 hydroxylase